jgi:hypothetical protein
MTGLNTSFLKIDRSVYSELMTAKKSVRLCLRKVILAAYEMRRELRN